jgi:hypothetical protein
MNIDPVTANTNIQTAMETFLQFLKDERQKAIDALNQANADNTTTDFVAAQNAQAASELQFQRTANADNLAMLQALQNGNNLATLLNLQGGTANNVFGTTTAFQAANAFLNVNTLLQQNLLGLNGNTNADTALFPFITEAATLNLANTLFQPLNGTQAANNGNTGTFDFQAFSNANNTINTTLNLLFSEIQTNAIFGLLSSLNVNTAGNAPTTTTP